MIYSYVDICPVSAIDKEMLQTLINEKKYHMPDVKMICDTYGDYHNVIVWYELYDNMMLYPVFMTTLTYDFIKIKCGHYDIYGYERI